MLDVRKHRLDYGEMLIPPAGYRLAKAVAATYTLDLNTLLSIPVSLFFSQTMEGTFDAERVQLLEAIQRCPEVLRIYHQQGKIRVPSQHNRLYGLLEPCVVGVVPPNAFTSFHPKVWVLRYESDETTKYRVIVLSRNLTYDRSWDVAVHLDGEVTRRAQAKNRPLVAFVRHLVSHGQFDGHTKFVRDLRRVEFQPPHGFNKNFVFHPIGLDRYENPLIGQTAAKAICMSPFVHDESVKTLSSNVSDELLLFGRREELRNLHPDSLAGVSPYCISDLIVDGERLDSAEDGQGEQLEQNLHAKLYVYQGDSKRALWFLGSANATKAAFQRNIEFLLELRGTSAAVQLDRLEEELLGVDEQAGLFEPYEPAAGPDTGSEDTKLEQVIRRLEFDLISCMEVKKAELTRSENEVNFDLHLELDVGSAAWRGLTVKVSPFNADGVEPAELAPKRATQFFFPNINEANLSSFLRFDIYQGAERLRSFLIRIPVAGLPESRASRIVKSIVNSRERFFEYLLFLLADDVDKEPVGVEPNVNHKPLEDAPGIWSTSMPVFEQLLLTASRSPSRLKAIDDLIEQLRREEDEQSTGNVVPVEFLQFWEAFKQLVPRLPHTRRGLR